MKKLFLLLLLIATPAHAQVLLRQSTASQEVALPRMLDDDDATSQKTGLTIANTDIKLFKSGATDFVSKNSGGATETVTAAGLYYTVLDATDTNTLGPLIIECQPSDTLAVRVNAVVLTANVYDSLVPGTDTLDVQVTGIGANVVTAAATATDFGTEIGNAVLDNVITDNLSANTLGAIFNAPEDLEAGVVAGLTTYGALKPTVSGRTLDVTSTGAAGIDFANVENPTTSVTLSGTTVGTATTIGATGVGAFWNALVNTYDDTAGSFGKRLGDNVDAPVSSIAAGSGLDAQETRDAMKLAPSGGAAATGSVDQLLNDDFPQTGDSFARIGANGAGLTAVTASGGTSAMLLKSTTIETLFSQTEFTLTDGSTDNNAYKKEKGVFLVITDSSDTDQKAVVTANAYVGATRRVTLTVAPVFTIDDGDTVEVMAAGYTPAPKNFIIQSEP